MWSYFYFDKPTNKQAVYKQVLMRNEKYTQMEYFRAIRARTVDLLGKTDQTCYYRNDLNCFKDPTCILLHWALSSTDL